jgi:hypothetical protein
VQSCDPFDNVTFNLPDTRKDSTERVVNKCPQQRQAQWELIAAMVYPGQVEGVIKGAVSLRIREYLWFNVTTAAQRTFTVA